MESGLHTPRRRHDRPLTLEDLLDTPERDAWRKRQMDQELEDPLAFQVSLGPMAAGADRSAAKLPGTGMAPVEERKGQ